MSEPAFPALVEQTLSGLFDALSAGPGADDLDLDIGDGLLNIVFEDGSKLILNRQEAVKQLWLATPWGGSHFRFEPGSARWIEVKTGAELRSELADAIEKKLGVRVKL